MDDLDRRWRFPFPLAIQSSCCLMISMPEAGSERRCRTPQIEITCHRARMARNNCAQTAPAVQKSQVALAGAMAAMDRERRGGSGSSAGNAKRRSAGAIRSQPNVYVGGPLRGRQYQPVRSMSLMKAFQGRSRPSDGVRSFGRPIGRFVSLGFVRACRPSPS